MYVGHKNTNLQNVPPTFCKFMSGHFFGTYCHLPPQRAVPCHGEEPLTTAARNRRTLYSTAAIADAFSDNKGETVVPSRGRLFNFKNAPRPLIFHCLQFFRHAKRGEFFEGGA